MPTLSVNLTDELDHFVLQKVESGRYEKRQRNRSRSATDPGA
jgi:Arc/MetJ-type ribon-helix-helix transcriptional regulator